jgi:hypothetical protein
MSLKQATQKEITYELFSDDGDADDAGVWARFSDGLEVQMLPEILTKGDLAKMQIKRGATPMAWEGMTMDSRRLWVARRKDRNGIVVLYMEKQI